MPPLPAGAVIREVGLRDGLQYIQTIVPTACKRHWIRAAVVAGEREIEVGSFVQARLLPQPADTQELVGHWASKPESISIASWRCAKRWRSG